MLVEAMVRLLFRPSGGEVIVQIGLKYMSLLLLLIYMIKSKCVLLWVALNERKMTAKYVDRFGRTKPSVRKTEVRTLRCRVNNASCAGLRLTYIGIRRVLSTSHYVSVDAPFSLTSLWITIRKTFLEFHWTAQRSIAATLVFCPKLQWFNRISIAPRDHTYCSAVNFVSFE